MFVQCCLPIVFHTRRYEQFNKINKDLILVHKKILMNVLVEIFYKFDGEGFSPTIKYKS